MLITLVCGLRLPVPVGIAGAVATYLFTSLLQRKQAEQLSPAPASNGLLTELTALSQKVAAHAIRLKIGEVVAQARALLNHLQNRPEGAAARQEYARDCLASATAATRRFTAVSSHVTEPTDPAVVRFAEFLTAISHALAQAHAESQAGQQGDPAAQIDRYQTTLRAINRAYFGSGPIP